MIGIQIRKDITRQLRERVAVSRSEWLAYHQQNPAVWNLFERYAFEAINSGIKRCSPSLVIQRIKWHHEVELGLGKLHVPSDFVAHYARLFNKTYPEHSLFATRPTADERKLAVISNNVVPFRRKETNNNVSRGTTT